MEIYCIPRGDIFILLLPNRLDNNTTVVVFSWLLCCNIWHLKSAISQQCVRSEGGVFWVGMITVHAIFLQWGY